MESERSIRKLKTKKFLEEKCGGDEMYPPPRLIPLCPPKKCHRNCVDYCRDRMDDFDLVRGWLVMEDGSCLYLIYHCVVRNKEGRLVDITRTLLTNPVVGFVSDKEWDGRLRYWDESISYKSSWMFDRATGEYAEIKQEPYKQE